ncbi:hypothetical protein, partial [Alkalithermobacter paradoxus]|uniref:hypothetical protein n=1 Tax=Alkalithermobacter paradoxus TaxID=29349 RepID=UPI001301FD00
FVVPSSVSIVNAKVTDSNGNLLNVYNTTTFTENRTLQKANGELDFQATGYFPMQVKISALSGRLFCLQTAKRKRFLLVQTVDKLYYRKLF